ncbi:MAG: tetratricopeptide repeat protein [Desulfobulbaceae bacterium]|jgi:predicted negative regulator of RcsB-dependent stress response|nr:tetratricopeptide repeat protein [Desulfobulbaceae bacterium]
MAPSSVFEKKHIDPSQMGKIESLLLHFNLPMPVIEGYRAHRALIHTGLIGLIVLVVALSLYDSWRSERIEKSASALATALSQEKSKLSDNLARLMDSYPRTNAALWAEIELARLEMEKKDYTKAASAYEVLLDKVGDGNPLRPPLLDALAQAQQAAGKYDAAIAAYEKLQKYKPYQIIACMGLGGQYEAKKEWDKAIAVYQAYKAEMTGQADGQGAGNETLAMLDEKIQLLRARK